jgi:branched-chain amino acid transport system substrate-binding protein
MNPQKDNPPILELLYWFLSAGATLALLAVLTSQRVHAREIVVAQSLDLSGQSNLGKDFSNGIRTYFDAVNARGGVRGRKINFVQLDDSGDPQQTVVNLRQLIRENDVDVLVAPTTGNSFLAAAADPSLRARGITLFGAPTGVRPTGAEGARTLTIRASYADEARQILNHIETMRIVSIGLIRTEGEEAEFAAAAFREEVKKRNKTLAFDGDATQWQARSANNAKLEAAVITGDAISVALPLAHARATARNATLFGFSTIDHRTLIEIAKSNATGMIISQAMPSADKTVFPFQREHRALMKRFRDEPPSLHTLEGYVVARMLIAAMESIDGDPTPARVGQALRQLRDLDLGPLVVSMRVPDGTMRFVNLSAVSTRGTLID